MSTPICERQLGIQSDKFQSLLDQNRFFDAHEALEEIWFPLRFNPHPEVKLLRSYINAAVSFELIKRGRSHASQKPWGNFIRHHILLSQSKATHAPHYQSIANHIIKTRKRVCLD